MRRTKASVAAASAGVVERATSCSTADACTGGFMIPDVSGAAGA